MGSQFKSPEPDKTWIIGCIIPVVAIGLLLYSCNSDRAETVGPTDSQYQITTLDIVRSRLRDPDSADFRNVETFRRDDLKAGLVVTCGEVNAANGFGGKTGYQRFIAGGVSVLESEMSEVEFARSWARLCN